MFKKAQRKMVKLRLAITGPSGSGKTYSALRIAKGFGGKFAVIDTENGSASLYSEGFDFDVVELAPPFTHSKYVEAIEFAEKNGYETLVIDSITHAWAGEGGLLEQKSSIDRRGGNSYTNWSSVTKNDNEFKSAFLHSSLNIICTIRSKQDYIIETNDKGKQVPRKVGLAPIQRDGIEYEFTTVFDVGMTHEASVSKDRTGMFVDRIFQLTEETGQEIRRWMNDAEKDPGTEKEITPAPFNKEDPLHQGTLRNAVKELNLEHEAGKTLFKKMLDKKFDFANIRTEIKKELNARG